MIFKPIVLSEMIQFEDSIGSISKGFQYFNPIHDEDFDDLIDEFPITIHKPLIFQRIVDDFYPTLHSWYFYDKDSIVKIIRYNWGFANTKIDVLDSEIMKQTARLKEYQKKYRIEKSKLIHIIGPPSTEDFRENESTYVSLKSIWDQSDKRVILRMTVDKSVMKFDETYTGKSIAIPRSHINIAVVIKDH